MYLWRTYITCRHTFVMAFSRISRQYNDYPCWDMFPARHTQIYRYISQSFFLRCISRTAEFPKKCDILRYSYGNCWQAGCTQSYICHPSDISEKHRIDVLWKDVRGGVFGIEMGIQYTATIFICCIYPCNLLFHNSIEDTLRKLLTQTRKSLLTTCILF